MSAMQMATPVSEAAMYHTTSGLGGSLESLLQTTQEPATQLQHVRAFPATTPGAQCPEASAKQGRWLTVRSGHAVRVAAPAGSPCDGSEDRRKGQRAQARGHGADGLRCNTASS